jgi:hypothetical protein
MPWGVIAIVIAVALSIVGLINDFGVFEEQDEDTSEPAASDPQPTGIGPTPRPVPQEVEHEPARIGESAVDGDFTFVVTAVEDGPAIIGDADFSAEPRGKFVLVTMTATNNGDSPRSLLGDNQFMIDTEGRRASADTAASDSLPGNAQSVFEEINAGSRVTSIVVFDIPADATPAGLELHDSASSSGVTVALG